MGLLWILASYILGSIPFGYIIAKFSGKNVLELGWKKTSGSNVFKNVGKWQGVATGLLDLAKGSLAVYGARWLGLPIEAQVFSGVAAVAGHNWSLFLGFAGGRGIGTFAGALLILSPKLLFVAVVLVALFALLWTAAVGTLVALAAIIAVFLYQPSFLPLLEIKAAGMLAIISLLPIFLKRLSPVRGVFEGRGKTALILNRLFFDDDKAKELRIKKIFGKVQKPIASTIMLPSKLGWQAAKYGANKTKNGMIAVRDGVKKYILREPEKVVTELGAADLKQMMIAAAKKIVVHQEEINRINVFPVADKDTGYNLAATLLGIEGTVARKEYPDMRELAKDMAEAAMINARGNVGMICTGYFVEVLDRVKHLDRIDAFHWALAMQRGVKASRLSIAEPVEGTILDVIKAAGEKAFAAAKEQNEKNIIRILEEAHRVSQIALKETTGKLQVLKEHNVVDAGALGYVKILEAWIENLKGVTAAAGPEEFQKAPEQPKAKEELRFRYEVVATFRKPENFDLDAFKEELSLLGDSLDVVQLEDRVKFHIHTDRPESAKERIKDLPELECRTEDMQEEVKAIEKKPLGLVVDDIADLPREFLREHDIEEVHFTSRFPDGEIITSREEIYSKMKEALEKGRPLPATSAPSFKEFISAYQKALGKFDKILAITVTAKLSGTYSSARIARSTYKKPEKLNIYVFDSATAETGEGLVALKSQELILQGRSMEEIVEELKGFCPKITLLASVEDFRYVVHGGRVKLPGFLVGPVSFLQKMGIRPLISLKNGRIRLLRIGLGKDVAKMIAKELAKRKNGEKIRAAIAHADNLEGAEKLKKELEAMEGVEIAFVSFVSPVIGTHTGPGALLVAFHAVG